MKPNRIPLYDLKDHSQLILNKTCAFFLTKDLNINAGPL